MKVNKNNQLLCAGVIFSFLTSSLSYAAEWTTSEINIYNTNTGKVGIGSTSPEEKLDVVGANDTDTFSQVRVTKTGIGNIRTFMGVDIQANGNDLASFGADSGVTDLSFKIGGKTLENEKMRITNSGNIGIGTTDPKGILHGQIPARTTAFDANNGSTWHDVIIQNPASVQNDAVGIFLAPGGYHTNAGTGIAAVKSHASDFSADLAFITRPFRAGAEERMRITHAGNVGIGVTDPQSKLVVDGTINAKEVKVTQTVAANEFKVSQTGGWADHVFADNYNLAPLEEVESFIKENKHLPDIPSAKEIEKDGLAMAEMMAKQMQKIEELTLYLIEVKKENARTIEANKKLQARLDRMENQRNARD